MDINQLRYFISVAQTLNFSEAARRHGITQPTISHHIGELEKQLDCRLLNRTKRSVELTEAGRVFLSHALQMVDIAEKASFQVRQAQAGQTGSVTISALTTSSAILSRCLSSFSSRYPNITVDMNFTSGQTQTLAMSDNRFDFHFAVAEMVPLGGIYHQVVTKHDRLCLAFPVSHPLAREPLDFSKLTGERFISVSESDSASLYGSIKALCKNRNFVPRVVCKCDRAEAVLLSVGAGMGISIIPEALGKVFYDENVILRPIPGEDAERTYVIAWQWEHMTPAAELFAQIVQELYGPAESR